VGASAFCIYGALRVDEILALVNKRGMVRNSISTALPYLRTVDSAISGARAGTLTPRDLSLYSGASWQAAMKHAAETLVYRNEGMRYLKAASNEADAKSGLTPVATFEAVITSIKQDRDNDVLHPEGAEVDPYAPLLWQHNPLEPIGKLTKVLSKSKDNVTAALAIADIPLGRDAAYLVEFGSLRISHGFRAHEFKPIKSGSDVVGFEVLKYDVMEVSLVSVPSNTDAVITAFARGKLTSPVCKSWGRSLYASRPIVVRGGFGGFKKAAANMAKVKAKPKTGRKLDTKASDDFEEQLAAAASTIVHSNDYGYCFYAQPDSAKEEYQVFWTAADSDGDGQTADGTPFTTMDDVKSILSNVPGVASVTIESEATPPKGEGWRMVYPEMRDWAEDSADDEQGNEDSEGSDESAEGQESEEGKGKKPKSKHALAGGKDSPVQGSFEAIASALSRMVFEYLNANGVPVDEKKNWVYVAATYADSVVVAVGENGTGRMTYYQIAYTMNGDDPVLSGKPIAVELNTVLQRVEDEANEEQPQEASGETDPAQAHAHPRLKMSWTIAKNPARQGLKGKLTRKDSSKLKEAQEHLEEAIGSGKMPSTIKTLVQRGADLVADVMKSDGSEATDEDTGSMEGLSGESRAIMAQARKAAAEKAPYALALALEALAAQICKEAKEADESQLVQLLTA
jgi:HK97 family phage prohead protease